MSDWRDIITAPKVEGVYYLGFDKETARIHRSVKAGLCVITWCEADEDDEWEADWQVQPFSEGLDCVASEHDLTHWQPLPSPPIGVMS